MEDNKQTNAGVLEPTGAEGKQLQLSPKETKESEVFTTMLMDVVHNEKTTGSVQKMLAAGDPTKSIPDTVMGVTDMATQTLTQTGGQPPSAITVIQGSIYLVTDLIELGNASGVFEVSPEQAPELLQSSLQKQVEKGVREGTIDPVELQSMVEPLLNDQEKQAGQDIGQRAGVPEGPTTGMAMDKYANDKLAAQEKTNTKKMELMKAQGALQRPTPPQQGGQV